MTIIAAADGSALGNPGPAGWGWYVDDDHWAAGGWPMGTNNMGELMAVLDLLRQTAAVDEDLLVYCDSTYVINSLTKWLGGWKRRGWKKSDGQPVLNVDLMKALDVALQGRRIHFEWVKGHAGHELNEQADRLATAAAAAYQAGRKPDGGPGYSSQVGAGRPVGTSAPLAPPINQIAGTGTQRSGQTASASRAGRPAPRPEPDLFATVDAVSDTEQVIALERALHADGPPADQAARASLLHPDWCEVTASGRLRLRREALAEPLRQSAAMQVDVDTVEQINEDVILLIWRGHSVGRSSLRSSLWQRTDGRWLQRFHQATAEL